MAPSPNPPNPDPANRTSFRPSLGVVAAALVLALAIGLAAVAQALVAAQGPPSGADSSVTEAMPTNSSGFPTVSYDGTEPAEVVAALQAGDHVVFIRHALTDYAQRDTGDVENRSGQRNLSAAGKAQAEQIGQALRRLGIPNSEVYAGPVFRARDTAELAFGVANVELTDALIADDYAGGTFGAAVDAARSLLADPPAEGTNRVLVGHRTPVEIYTGLEFPDAVLPEGALAVFAPAGEGGADLVGTITAEELVAASDASLKAIEPPRSE